MDCRAKELTFESGPHLAAIVCCFCGKGLDEKKYGELKVNKADLTDGKSIGATDAMAAHYFCLLFSSGLAQLGTSDDDGLSGFLLNDIQKEVNRGKKLRCAYCKFKGATVGCSYARCKLSYHYNCGRQHRCLFMYKDDYRSYCPAHRPIQPLLLSKLNANPEPSLKSTLKSSQPNSAKKCQLEPVDMASSKQTPPLPVSRASVSGSPAAVTLCYICYGDVPITTETTYNVIIAPCCTQSLYHRECMEEMAYSAGVHFFRCPLCNNKSDWQRELAECGIYIPDRDALWELEPNAYNSLLERRVHCDAIQCLCPDGREFDDEESQGGWEVLLCESCGSQGIHVSCIGRRGKCDSWLCDDCRPAHDRLKAERQKEKSGRKRPKVETPGRPSRYTRKTNREIRDVTNLLLNSSLNQEDKVQTSLNSSR